jgi:hypothetical protein
LTRVPFDGHRGTFPSRVTDHPHEKLPLLKK